MSTSERVVVGLGATSSATVAECVESIRATTRPEWTVDSVATIDSRVELGREVADALDVSLVTFTAAELSGVSVPSFSERARTEVHTSSVCEAAAVLAAGGGDLLVPKLSVRVVTVAIARVG